MSEEVNLLQSQSATQAQKQPVQTNSGLFVIDASSANKEKRTGVEQYAFYLIESMKLTPLNPGDRVVLISPTPLNDILGALPEGWSSKVLGWPLKKGWMRLRVSWEMMRMKPSVVFVPSQAVPHVFGSTKLVTTIHDVGQRQVPQLYDPSVRRRIERVTKRSISHADALLTVSNFTKEQVQSLYGVTAEKLTVSLLAADIGLYKLYSEQERLRVLQKYRLGTNVFLSVGRIELKKNPINLIRGFEQFKESRGHGDPHELVFVGESGFGFESVKPYFERSPAASHMKQLGFVPDEDLAVLLSAAKVYVFPSWYEGFGIPNLEAMAAGTSLLTSDIEVHREVAGDAALYAAPNNPPAWAEQMKRIAEDSALVEALVQKGFERVKEFSWEKTADVTWNVLRSLVY